ncbi:hypothetical protein [Spiroplasma syrphidicola]|nr:hypothetical protein [Spiroplasma syrphidicola]
MKKDIFWTNSIKLTMKITIIAVFSALGLALKAAFAFLPNIEFVTFILMFSIFFFSIEIGFGIVNVYCTLNMVTFGIADWSLMYFVIFNLYAVIILWLKPLISKWWWTMIIMNGLFGYLFGSLYAIQTALLFNSTSVGLAYWINGLVFDAIHGTGNIIVTALLFAPVYKLMEQLVQKWPFIFNNRFIINSEINLCQKNKLSKKELTLS